METEYIFLKHSGPTPSQIRSRFKPSLSVDELLAGARATEIAPEQSLQVHHEKLSLAQAADASRDNSVLASAPVMPMSLIRPLAVPSTESAAVAQARKAGASWGIHAIGADKSDESGQDVTVAVLDTGIDASHPAFHGMTFEQQDFTGNGSAADDNGHGTHCAGTIFGRDVDGVRIGVARGVTKAFIGKVLDKTGNGSSAAVAKGVEWAIAARANVISMSVGFDFPGMVQKMETDFGFPATLAASRALRAFRDNLRLFDSLMTFAQAQAATSSGSVLVAASGNESQADQNPDFRVEVSLPAASIGIVSVGALRMVEGNKLAVAPFSNIDPTVSAPGTDIVSALLGGGLAAASGTSMACPHVAGAAVLWWQHLQKQGLATAQLVSANLITRSRTDGFLPGASLIDRGAGIIQAPQPSG